MARASRSSRERRVASVSPERSTLIATARSRSGSKAAHTIPIPPAPSTRSSRYLPSISPAVSPRDSRAVSAAVSAVGSTAVGSTVIPGE